MPFAGDDDALHRTGFTWTRCLRLRRETLWSAEDRDSERASSAKLKMSYVQDTLRLRRRLAHYPNSIACCTPYNGVENAFDCGV